MNLEESGADYRNIIRRVATISGKLCPMSVQSCRIRGRVLVSCEVPRLSESSDIVPVTISERLTKGKACARTIVARKGGSDHNSYQ